MRSRGACPAAAVFEKASIGRAGEGMIPAQTIMNEFEAKTLIPSAELGARLETARPGLLDTWHALDEGRVAMLLQTTGSKDFRTCAEVAASFGAETTGIFVGRLARTGLTRDYPFLIQAGLDHFVCNTCRCWVARREARRHNAFCVGDIAGNARVFWQKAGEDLGVKIAFKHLPKSDLVELRAEAPLDSVVRRAGWACYWPPDDTRCAWRLARRPASPPNAFPTTAYSSDAPARKPGRRARAQGTAADAESASEGGTSDEGSDLEDGHLEQLEGTGAVASNTADTANPNVQDDAVCSSKPTGTASSAGGPLFTLKTSYGVQQACQPLCFLKPLTSAQLHTLGWMRQREDSAGCYTSKQTLRQVFAETDVCLEVRLERDFKAVRGGILADALGYGKTACMIALVAETRKQSLPDLLSLSDWPAVAGRRILTNATLVVTPTNLFDQWIREIRKFVHPDSGLRILTVPSHSKLKTYSVADFVAADIVLVSFRFFFSEAYQRYFDELTKPGLKVWDEASVQRRAAYLQSRRAKGKKASGAAGSIGGTAEQPPDTASMKVDSVQWLNPASLSAKSEPVHVKREACGTQANTCGESVGAETQASVVPGSFPAGRATTKLEAGVKAEPCAPAEIFDIDDDAVGVEQPRGNAPALQLSKYYLEVKAGPDYLPQRYLDCERRTKRLLRESDAGEIARGPALLEMFHFKRVVFDEFHEVVRVSSEHAASATGTSRLPFYALHALQGRSHWGLTATPFLSSPAAVAQMALLLRVFIPYDDQEEAQRFLDTWVTSNTWDEAGAELEEHWVEVELTGPERALYLHQRNALSEQGGGAGGQGYEGGYGQVARAAERRLLQLCSHFDPEPPDGEHAADAEAALSRAVRRQRAALAQAVERRHFNETQREELLARRDASEQLRVVLPSSSREAALVCAHCALHEAQGLAEAARHASDARLTSELALVEGELRRLAQAAVDGQAPAVTVHSDEGCEPCRQLAVWEERLRYLSRSKGQALGDQRHAETQLRFLEAMLDTFDSPDVRLECPVCFKDATPQSLVILPCGHRFHEACAASAVNSRSCCPQCRRPATMQMFTSVQGLLPTAAVSSSAASSAAAVAARELRRTYGSKLAKVVETIQGIQQREGDAMKCLVFLQWDALAAHLERSLCAAGIQPLVLRGHLPQRQKVISRFVDGKGPAASVLLLSLEQSPSGMNLIAANHVLLVHPMYAERAEEAVAHELQAIGRARRQGQHRRVHVYRFAATGTVEESLARQHRASCAGHKSE